MKPLSEALTSLMVFLALIVFAAGEYLSYTITGSTLPFLALVLALVLYSAFRLSRRNFVIEITAIESGNCTDSHKLTYWEALALKSELESIKENSGKLKFKISYRKNNQ